MSRTVAEVMTPNPLTLPATATVVAAATLMRDADVGDVIVADGNDVIYGIVTDRDVCIRAVADGLDPLVIELGQICSRALATVSPSDDVDEAVQLMRNEAIRRLPVVEAGKAVGILSLGDLAIERDPGSVLATIAAARPSH